MVSKRMQSLCSFGRPDGMKLSLMKDKERVTHDRIKVSAQL